MVHRRTAKLAGWQIWLLSLSGVALWLSGAAWLLLHYYGQQPGEFGPEMNPLEPWMMKLHGLVLIPALLGIGGMLVVHIPKGWAYVHQRIAGIALCAVLGVLIASGYMLYYVGDELVRDWTSMVHWIIGLVLPAVFLWHYLNGLLVRRRKAGSGRDRVASPGAQI
ncbi:hypothetical protein B0I00_2539 [Novosphingobium kunmingense]|uniref:DUF4405 domain-containing protein n=1 Tax=Novosphingobium kunmingense TaxID=1211806 RepID=A0A2N0H7N4_9SPHN|nr:hypothetical protein [Novosphingobium kunmingense]PKB14937.1 hypothetical protein B0I00_2539 [Novosphingobium kunmingense]